nr:hypothetical protein GCM10020093_117720 [Planobispora longispora]
MLAAPVYGAGDVPDAGLLRGWLLMGVRGVDFVDGTLKQIARGVINAKLTDVSVPGQERQLAALRDGEPIGDTGLYRETPIDVGGRQWKLELQPTAGFLTTGDTYTYQVIMSSGAVASLLLAGLVLVLVTSRDRALARVEQATSALQADIAHRQQVETHLREREAELERFAAVAAHDLKSPLTVIMGYCELVEDRVAERVDSQVTGWLKRVRTGTRRMQHLIDDLLAYAAAGDGTLDLEEVDLDTLVSDIVMERTTHLEDERPNIEFGRLRRSWPTRPGSGRSWTTSSATRSSTSGTAPSPRSTSAPSGTRTCGGSPSPTAASGSPPTSARTSSPPSAGRAAARVPRHGSRARHLPPDRQPPRGRDPRRGEPRRRLPLHLHPAGHAGAVRPGPGRRAGRPGRRNRPAPRLILYRHAGRAK